jgi:hypothetical protein
VILSTILRPPAAPPEDEAPETVETERQTISVTQDRHRRYRRAVAAGVAISVIAHVLLVRLSPLLIRYLEQVTFVVPVRPIEVRPEGMQALDVQIVETPEVPPETQPEPEPQPEPPVVADEFEGEAVPSLTVAERLRPRVGDWRLWIVPPIEPRRDLPPEEQLADVRSRLYAEIEAWNDSIAREMGIAAENLDWTVGEEGNKWGVSPGRLHLGPVTLPLPFAFAPDPAQARLYEDMIDDYNAIRRQAGDQAIRDSQDDRIRAIREREQAKREAEKDAQRDTTGGPLGT